MKFQSSKSFKMLLMLIAIMLVLAACGGQSNEPAPADPPAENETNTNANGNAANDTTGAAGADNAEYPIEIEHALGKATLESKPERIVTIQWANHDVVLALGIVPVGFSAANFGVQDDSGLLPWTKEKLDELGVTEPNVFMDTDGLDFEAINDAKPDVILAAYSGITAEDYETLSQIAPVVAYPVSPWTTTWREQIELNAAGMGMAEEGDQLIKDTEAMIQEKLADYPQLAGKKVVWANFSDQDLSKMHIYTPVDSRVAFLEELGLTYPDSITAQITDPTAYSLSLSAENAENLSDVDLIVGYGTAALYETLKADPLLGKIPAIEKGAVAFIDSDSPLVAAGTPNPLSIAYTIDEYLQMLGEAIDKGNE